MNKKNFRKIYNSPDEALKDILFDGMTIMSGGFGLFFQFKVESLI